jgi:hypothetical protein
MLIAAGVALWKGLHIHQGHKAALAFVLAAMALGMAIWHLTRRPRKQENASQNGPTI